MKNRNYKALKYLIELIKDDSLEHLEKKGEVQHRETQVDDKYELFKYSLLLRDDCTLIDVIRKDTFDNLMRTWFADVSNLIPDQRKLNEKLLGILKDLPYCIGDTEKSCIIRLAKFLEDESNQDLETVLNLQRGESKLTVLHALSSLNLITEKCMDRAVKQCMYSLLKAGADPNKPDSEGKTPLHYAACSGYDVTVNLLLRKGALNIPDKQEQTPLEVAIDNHNYNVERLFLTCEQNNLLKQLYHACQAIERPTELRKFLKKHKDTQDFKRVLNLHNNEGKSEILQFVRNILLKDEAFCKEAERLLLEAGAIDYKGLDRKESLPKSGTLWDNLILNQQQRLKMFLDAVDTAQDMNKLEQVVNGAIVSGVRFNFPHQGKLYGEMYESKYSFMDYVIKRIKEISKSEKNSKVASDIVCKLISRGAVLYNINSIDVIDALESEFKDHKTNMKEAHEDYVKLILKFMEIVKSAATGKVKDAKMDNSTLYLEYSEDSTINVAKITDGARNLGLTQGEIGYGRDVIKIGKSEVEIITKMA